MYEHLKYALKISYIYYFKTIVKKSMQLLIHDSYYRVQAHICEHMHALALMNCMIGPIYGAQSHIHYILYALSQFAPYITTVYCILNMTKFATIQLPVNRGTSIYHYNILYTEYDKVRYNTAASWDIRTHAYAWKIMY